MSNNVIVENVSTVVRPARQLLVILVSQVLSWCCAMVVTVTLPAYRTVDEYAFFSLAFTFSGLVGCFCDSGLSSLISRTITSDGLRSRNILVAAIIVRIGITAVGCVVFAILLTLLHYPKATIQFILLGVSLSFVGHISGSIKDVIRGFGRVSTTSWILLLERLFNAGIVLALAMTHQSVYTFLWVPLIFEGIGIYISVKSLRAHSSLVSNNTITIRHEIKFLLTQLLILSSGVFILQIKDPLNLILISNWGTSDDVGSYSFIRRIVGSAMFLPVAIAQLGLPMMTRAYMLKHEAFRHQFHALLQSTLMACFPVMVIFAFHGYQILGLIHLYPKFTYGPTIMALSTPLVFMLYLAVILTNAVIACGRQAKLVKGVLIVGLSMPLLSIGLIYALTRIGIRSPFVAVVSDMALELWLIIVYLKALDEPINYIKLIRPFTIAVLLSIPLSLAGIFLTGFIWMAVSVACLLLYVGVLFKLDIIGKKMLECELNV